VIDVADLEVPLHLERRLDPFHVRAVRIAVDLARDVVERDEAIRRTLDEDPAALASRSSAATSSMLPATVSILSRMSFAARCAAEPPMMMLRAL